MLLDISIDKFAKLIFVVEILLSKERNDIQETEILHTVIIERIAIRNEIIIALSEVTPRLLIATNLLLK